MGFFDDIVAIARDVNSVKQEITDQVMGAKDDLVQAKDDVTAPIQEAKDGIAGSITELNDQAASVGQTIRDSLSGNQ